MKYLTPKELKEDCRDYAHSIVDKCEGPSVRYDFGINAFRKWRQEIFGGRNDIKTLDLGTARGGFERQLKEIGYTNVYGVDIDDYLDPQNKPLLKEFKTADLSWDKLPWPDNTFQIVTGWCILPHLENPFHCLREVYRVLDKGGIFIFIVPHLTSKPAMDYFVKHKDFGSYRATNNHLVQFTPAIIQKTVLKYFELIDVGYAVRTAKIFRGIKGQLRKLFYELITPFPKLKKLVDHRWGYDAIYVVRKP